MYKILVRIRLNNLPDLSAERQLLLLFSFYCFANVLGSLISIVFLQFTSGQVSKLSLGLLSISGFFLPAFIAFKLFSKKKLASYWGFSTSFSSRSFLLTILIMACCIILMNWLAEVNKLIPLYSWMEEDEREAGIQLKEHLKMDNFWQLLLNLLIFSFVPSICEEVYFRGTMQPLWYKYYTTSWISILTTAFIFSFLHFQFSAFLPLFLVGIVFGGIFYLTGSLWLSIISHVFYNGLVVMLNYMNQHKQVNLTTLGNLLLSPLLLILAALLMLLLFYLLQRETFKNQNYISS